MNRIIDRARAAMNLILIVSILAGITLSETGPDVLALAKQIQSDAEILKEFRDLERDAASGYPIVQYQFLRPTDTFLEKVGASGLDAVLLKDALDMRSKLVREMRQVDPQELENFDLDAVNPQLAANIRVQSLAYGPKFDAAVKAQDDLRSSLEELDNLIRNWSLDETDTFNSAHSKLIGSIRVPIIDQEFKSRMAPWIVLAGLLAPMLYLISICETVRLRLKDDDGSMVKQGFDWIFLHSHWVGPVLGSAWLALPVMAICVGIFQGVFRAPVAVLIFLVSASVSSAAILFAWRMRKSYLSGIAASA